MTIPAQAFSAGGRPDDAPPVDSDRQEVERALRGSSHNGLRTVRCQYVDGRVTLNGEVASYYLKQVAQTIVGRLANVSSVDNQLLVAGLVPPASRSATED